MFDPAYCIQQLSLHRETFGNLLTTVTREQYLHKPLGEKWCLLEIVCHLYDEEREDFRARLAHVLHHPGEPLPPIDPQGWVQHRKYMEQDYTAKLDAFMDERSQSVAWLNQLKNPAWENAYPHPKFGPMSAKLFLANWVAHDYLHVRQIMFTLHDYLKSTSGESLNYAGDW